MLKNLKFSNFFNYVIRKWNKKLIAKFLSRKQTSWNLMRHENIIDNIRAPKRKRRSEYTTTSQKNLPCRIGHDITILISCALPHVFVVCGLSATRVTTWRSQLDSYTISHISLRFCVLDIHEKKLMWRLHSTKMYLIKNLFFFVWESRLADFALVRLL